jgi:hypothetical protein
VGHNKLSFLPESMARLGALVKPETPTVGPNQFFQALYLHWRAPESGDLRHKSRRLKKEI